MKDLIEEIVQTALDLKEVVGINYKTDLIPMAIELHKLQAAQEANELFKKAHVISATDAYPTALESIAIQLGFKTKRENQAILNDISFLDKTSWADIELLKKQGFEPKDKNASILEAIKEMKKFTF